MYFHKTFLYYRTFLFSLLLMVGMMPASFAAEPPNLDVVKKELIRYHDSGEYYRDIASVQQQAIVYLLQRIDENNALPTARQKKLAIVLDIDETSLSNYRDMLAMNFGGTWAQKTAAQAQALDPAIPPTLALYKLASSKGVAVFFVTGRSQTQNTPTIKNLQAAGYNNWAGLIMRPNDYQATSVIPYKSGARQKIKDAGYDIVLDIGDQESDLKGGYADETFKVPNPYYFIP